MECSHDIVESGHCVECGMEVCHQYCMENNSSFMTNGKHYSRTNNYISSVCKELMSMDIDQKIKVWVNDNMSVADNEIFGQSSKRDILYAYIYVAHQMFPEIKFDLDLWKKSYVTKKQDYKKVVRLASGIIGRTLNDDKGPLMASIVTISPIYYLPEMISTLNIQNLESNIIDYSENLLLDTINISYINPKVVAVALIKHYIRSSKIKSVPNLEKRCGVAPSIVNSVIKNNFVKKII